jgi:hypothetical protein
MRKTKPKDNYRVPPPEENNPIIPQYNGKPADLIYASKPEVSRPLLLDMYGEEYENPTDLRLVDSTNKRPVEVSGYYLHPNYIDKSAIKTTQNLKVSGIIL